MPLPSPSYVAMFPLQEVIIDKDTGAPLSAGIITFYVDETNRTQTKDVYIQQQQPNNTYQFLNIGSMITLSSVGTPQYLGTDIIPFMWPYKGSPTDNPVSTDIELYEVFVESSTNIAQFSREAWPPNVQTGTDPTDLFEGSENAISNPQFAKVLFAPDIGASTYTLTISSSPSSIEIAPGWTLETTGTGSVILQQLDISDSTAISNPAYALSIQSSGLITSMRLQQKFDETPRLFANGYVNGSVVASSSGSVARNLKLYYVESNGSSWLIVNKNTTDDNLYSIIQDTKLIVNPPPISTDAAPTGYSLFYIDLPLLEVINITSVQLVTVQNQSSSTEFLQEPVARQVDHLFHYYKPQLDYKPIPSLLTGWDFPLNPAQLGDSGSIGANGAYLWDQTIGARGAAVTGTYARSSVTSGLQMTMTGTNNAVEIIQYLSGAQAKKMIGTKLSVNVNAFKASADGAVIMRVYLYRGSAAATIPTLGNLIGFLSSNGAFALSQANWSLINRDSLGLASANITALTTNPQLNTSNYDYGFSGWQITDSTEIGDTDKFAIVVTFGYTTANTVITINSISVVPGDIPTRPAPQTPDEVLRECQYYYSKSFAKGTAPIQALGATTNASAGAQTVAATTAGFGPIVRFPVEQRTLSTITLFNPINANAQIYNSGTGTDWSLSTTSSAGVTGFVAIGTSPGGSAIGNGCYINWTSDARLGVV